MNFEPVFISVIGVLCLYLSYLIGKIVGKRSTQQDIQKERDDAVKRSRAVLTGKFSEQLAPYFPDFPFSPTEARFIGNPVDFVVFEGADNQNIKQVTFVEVKSGKSQLSTQERKLRDTIRKGNVKWEQYNT